MKKSLTFLLSIILCVAVFSGCSATVNIDYTDTYIFGQDSQENYIRYQSQRYFAESEDSYFFLNTDNGFLYTIDKATHICRPLCNKSNCLHDREASFANKKECNAFINTMYESIVYYDGSLYCAVDDEDVDNDGVAVYLRKIIKLPLDGSARETVYETKDYEISDFKIHRGYIYYNGARKNPDGATDLMKDRALMKVPVSGGKEEELLPYYKHQDAYINDARFYGNHIFLWVEKPKNTEIEYYLINYDLQTNTCENLSDKLEVNIDSMFTVFNDKLIFANGSKVYECDFDGSNQKEVLDCKEVVGGYKYYTPFTHDGEHLIISMGNDERNSNKLIFCDKEYKPTVYELPMEYQAEIGFDKNAFLHYDSDDCALNLIDKTNFKTEKIYTFPDN